jgi:hypothetical protein
MNFELPGLLKRGVREGAACDTFGCTKKFPGKEPPNAKNRCK